MIYWDRITLKTRAKSVLRNSYWMTFLALIIVGVLGGFSSFNPAATAPGIGFSLSLDGGFYWDSVMAIVGGIMVVGGIFGLAYTIFVGNVIEVGKSRYLTMCRYGEVSLGEIFFSFKEGRYWNTVKTMFFRSLYIFLWSLLFVIPGIIKAYSYWMVPYIMAENPWISKERAFEISKMTTQGEKWNIFVLNLSFLGWTLLGALACGVGTYFVTPYIEATNAELYGALRYKAVMSGYCTPEEIGKELFAQPAGQQ